MVTNQFVSTYFVVTVVGKGRWIRLRYVAHTYNIDFGLKRFLSVREKLNLPENIFTTNLLLIK